MYLSCHFKQEGCGQVVLSLTPLNLNDLGHLGFQVTCATGILGGCSVITDLPLVWFTFRRGQNTGPGIGEKVLILALIPTYCFPWTHLQFQGNHHRPTHFRGSKRDQVG